MSRFDPSLWERALRAIGKPAPEPALPEGQSARSAAVEITAALCRRFEGYRREPYLCPAGVPTIGYGATHYLDGRAVRLTDPPIPREATERLLLRQIERVYLPAVLRLCPEIAQHHPRRSAAIIDFTFNLGAARLQASTLRRRINAGEWAQVPAELRKWVIGGGRVLRGLVIRREAEAALV